MKKTVNKMRKNNSLRGEFVMKKTFKKITSIILSMVIMLTLTSAAFAYSSDDWGESSYVRKAVKNSFIMEMAEDDVEADDDVSRYHAAETVVNLYEQINGTIKADEKVLKKFEDYRDIIKYYDDDQIELVAKATKLGVLKGNKTEDGLYAYLDDSATRAEMAAFFERAVDKMDIDLDDNYSAKNFRDTDDHWAEDVIEEICELGVMEGYSNREFGVDDEFKYEDMLIVFFRICYFEGESMDLDEFIDGINESLWVYLTLEDYYGTEFELREFDEDLEVGRNYKVKVDTDISGFINSDAEWESSKPSVAIVSSKGIITPKEEGKTVISAECNGMEDSITVYVVDDDDDNDDDNDNTTSSSTKKMIGTQSVISIQVGDSVDLEDYLENVPGTLKFSMSSNNYIELDGSEITGKKATKDGDNVVVTATSEGQKVKFDIRVTNMNITTNLDPEVEWSANNETGTVVFTIRDINDDCEIKLNADSEYEPDLQKVASDGSWATYKVQNMEEIGGTTCLVVRVLIDGVQIWESDPEIFYFGD